IDGVPTLQALNYSREFSMLDLWIDPAQHRVARTELRPLTMICANVFEKSSTCDPKLVPAGTPLVPRVFEGKTIAADAKVAALLTPTGAQVVEMLRITSDGKRGTLQPSGVRYTYDASKVGADRLVSVNMPNGDPIDPNKLYRVVVPDFLVSGGEGLGALMKQV